MSPRLLTASACKKNPKRLRSTISLLSGVCCSTCDSLDLDLIDESDSWLLTDVDSTIRALDEHTKLARAALHFETDLDELFRINIAKMRVQLPVAVKQMLDRPVSELCFHANDVYRRHDDSHSHRRGGGSSSDLSDVGIALKAAALEAGQLAAINEVAKVLQARSPDLSRALGFD